VTARTVTQSVETNVQPGAMVEILMDPRHIPQWAPAFADAIEADAQDGWRVRKDGSAFSLQVVVTQSSRTVDYLREVVPGKQGGAYIRVLPRPNGGSVVVMTVPVPAGADAGTVTAILSQELKALVDIGESRTEQR
jgi:hypothetical protein